MTSRKQTKDRCISLDMPPLEIESPTIVHHMAALDEHPAPPNSLQAIQLCLEAGAAFIEVDITALAREDFLLVHDPELEAETSGQGSVAGCTPEQARQLYIKQDGVVSEHPVALLSDVVHLLLQYRGPGRLQLDFQPHTFLQLDLKDYIPRPGDEPLFRLARLIEPLGDRVIVSAGADWQLRRLRQLAPWLTLGFDVMWHIDWQPPNTPRDPRVPPRQLGAYGYYDDHMLATGRHWTTAEYLRDRCDSLMGLVPDVAAFYIEHTLLAHSLEDGFNWAEALHERGIKLDAWTLDVTNPVAVDHAPRLLAAGVDLFTSNTPRALAKLLGLKAA